MNYRVCAGYLSREFATYWAAMQYCYYLHLLEWPHQLLDMKLNQYIQ